MAAINKWEDQLQSGALRVIVWLSLLFLTFTMGYVFFVLLPRHPELLEKVLQGHFPALTGIPLSAISATIVIACFRTALGEIEFKAFGFEFKGASGPATLWVVCFLALVVGIRLLWGLPVDVKP